MRIRSAARGLSLFYLLTGTLSRIPPLVVRSPEDDELVIDALGGKLFGLFPSNAVHAVAHVLYGALGLRAARSHSGALRYSQLTAAGDGLLALLGALPDWRWRTLFGLMPIYGHDVWLHALAATTGAYFGWVAPASVTDLFPATDRRQEAMGL